MGKLAYDISMSSFVVTHNEPEEIPDGGVYTFVTGGMEAALQEAKTAAGRSSAVPCHQVTK